MALMSLAAGAVDFGPGKDQLVIGCSFDHFGIDRLPETGPTGAAVELVLRGKEGQIASCAVVDTGFLVVVKVVGKGALGILMP